MLATSVGLVAAVGRTWSALGIAQAADGAEAGSAVSIKSGRWSDVSLSGIATPEIGMSRAIA